MLTFRWMTVSSLAVMMSFEEVELEEVDTVYGNSIITYSYQLPLLNFSDGDGNNSSPEDKTLMTVNLVM